MADMKIRIRMEAYDHQALDARRPQTLCETLDLNVVDLWTAIGERAGAGRHVGEALYGAFEGQGLRRRSELEVNPLNRA